MTDTQAIQNVIDALDTAGVAYMFTGSLASNAYGVGRATKDADIVVDFQNADIADIAAHLVPAIHLQEQMMFETITGTTRYILEIENSPFKIELFHINQDPFMSQRFERRISWEYPGFTQKVWLPTPEDVVIQKLRWGREKDLADVADVLFMSGANLDYTEIEKWCTEHGTLDRLTEIRKQLPPDLGGI